MAGARPEPELLVQAVHYRDEEVAAMFVHHGGLDVSVCRDACPGVRLHVQRGLSCVFFCTAPGGWVNRGEKRRNQSPDGSTEVRIQSKCTGSWRSPPRPDAATAPTPSAS